MTIRHHRLPLAACVVLIAALSAAGCAHLGLGIEKPKVTPRGVSVESAGLAGLRGTVHLSVLNPNSIGLPLRRATFRLAIGGAEAATGELSLSETIPAKASAPVDASIAVDGLSAVRAISNYASGERRYTIRGTLYFESQVGEVAVSIEHHGQLGELRALAP